jgi:hypothetical protein
MKIAVFQGRGVYTRLDNLREGGLLLQGGNSLVFRLKIIVKQLALLLKPGMNTSILGKR